MIRWVILLVGFLVLIPVAFAQTGPWPDGCAPFYDGSAWKCHMTWDAPANDGTCDDDGDGTGEPAHDAYYRIDDESGNECETIRGFTALNRWGLPHWLPPKTWAWAFEGVCWPAPGQTKLFHIHACNECSCSDGSSAIEMGSMDWADLRSTYDGVGCEISHGRRLLPNLPECPQ